MNRITRFIMAALFVATFVSTANAQTQNSDATASVVIAANLTVTNTRGMDFGTVFASAGIVRTTNATSAQWSGLVDPGNQVNATFAIPSSLVRAGGGGSAPFSCNTISGAMIFGSTDGGQREFNPYVGSGPYLVSPGNDFYVALGNENSVPDYGCKVDVTGRPAGSYTGIITLTLTVL
jgi:hypothetical protein